MLVDREQLRWRRIVAAVVALSWLMSTAAIAAAEISITCPATDAVAELKLQLSGATLTVTGADGSAALPATLNGDPAGMFTVEASGPIESAMPAPATLDECVAGKLQAQGATATDTEALAFSLNQCRLKLASASSQQKVDASYILTSMEKGSASLFISRRYTMPSVVTGAALQLDEWPMRQCMMMSED